MHHLQRRFSIFILLTYDVDITTEGQKRLRHIAKICENYGIRVQKSVFELNIDPAKLVSLKKELINAMDADLDSIRIYSLGKNADKKVEVLGCTNKIELSKDTAIFL